MDEAWIQSIMAGTARGPVAGGLRAALAAAEVPYRMIVALRNELFRHGIFPARRVPAFVVSVGNLTTGGTGKTPLTADLAARLNAQGMNPGIVSRGYRAQNEVANDEQMVLQHLCPGIPQAKNPDRVAGSLQLIRDHDCKAILLDDAFQHRWIQRDVDLVLVDAVQPWGYNALLPRGLMREPAKSLKRASMVILTRVNLVTNEARRILRDQVSQWTSSPIAEVAFEPDHFLSLNGESLPLSWIAGRRAVGFCGIGNPTAFKASLASMDVGEFHPFPDHHHYRADEIRSLVARARAARAECLITTLKDLVKIPPEWLEGFPCLALSIRAKFLSGESELDQLIATPQSSTWRHAA